MVTMVRIAVEPFLNENKSRFKARCKAIHAQCDLDVEYDGRDVFIEFSFLPVFGVTELCQLLVGLLDKKSNFKKELFKAYPFMHCEKKLERIYFEFLSVVTVVTKKSDPIELMRNHYRKLNYIVLPDDTEKQIKKRSENLLKLYSFVYSRFLEEVDNSDLREKRKNIIFLSEEAKDSYQQKEAQIYNKRFKEFLKTYELDSDAPDESKELLILLKKWQKVI